MVFCQLIEKTNEYGKYRYGFTTDDLSGQAIFDIKGNCTVLKQPKPHKGIGQDLIFILNKHKEEFQKGNFRDRLSYQF